MQNQIITYEQTESQVSVYSDVNIYGQYLEMAKDLSQTELVPTNSRNKPENCLLAIDVARQIGCKSPLFVMQNLYVVNGKPSWSGQYCTAVVRANFKDVKVIWYGKIDGAIEEKGCRVTAIDKNGTECIGTKVTIEMAKKEGWYSKKDKFGKETSKWQTMPEQMLQYRAFTFFARVYCPEKLLGINDEYEQDDILIERSEAVTRLDEKLQRIAEESEK